MCFDINKNIQEKPKRAKEDIVVWKVLKKKSDGTLESPFQYTSYQKGIIKRAKLNITYCSVYEGLHSYIARSKARLTAIISRERAVFRAIIPKGALYLKNETQYVSNRLLIPLPVPLKKKTNGKSKKKVRVKQG